MASIAGKVDAQLMQSVRSLLWGPGVKEDVFSRWSQGFVFSESEPTALVQYEGGPCAVIAPVQAFLLKHALFIGEDASENLDVSEELATTFLLKALVEILVQLSSTTYIVMSLEKNSQEDSNDSSGSADTEDGETSPKRARMDIENFHSNLRFQECSDMESLKACLNLRMPLYKTDYGVLLYLYSIILTKGVQQIKNEVEDPSESLIDGKYGHGSQSLINLLVTGKAVCNVWDKDKEVSGLKMMGIQKQSTVGFLTLLEHLRYCEVGWYLKNPKFPIWLLGSETHLTVFFSKERGIVVPETQEVAAKRIFQKFDQEGNGFISTSSLGELLQELDLGSEKEYVDTMRNKLDSENLGIITLSSFMSEFYPEGTYQNCPKSFTVYQYNGLKRSNVENKVRYEEGLITLQDDCDMHITTESSAIKTCLETKWSFMDLTWKTAHVPSLN